MTSAETSELHNPLSLRAGERGRCPSCLGAALSPIIDIENVPTNSCLMLESAAEARAYPRGDIALTFCTACGFIFNRSFDALLTEYSERYEPTQAYSPTFLRFHEALAQRLVDNLGLRGKTVAEIGCGQGEFLHLICRLGGNKGIGFDPCLDQDRRDVVRARSDDVTLTGKFFAEESVEGLKADLLISKMTLEHIPAVARFAQAAEQVARQSPSGMRIFIQIPESERIFKDCAFEDIYYEHCNYFTEVSLVNAFARQGFEVEEITREYEGQYLAIVARHAGHPVPTRDREAILSLKALLDRFKPAFARKVAHWHEFVQSRAAAGPCVIWGSGSKGVSFLSAIESQDLISHVVDINPHRQGKFMVGSGHPIIGPSALSQIKPKTVIVMNAVYRHEIAQTLAEIDLKPELVSL
jgi:hypothetical protein